MCRFTEWSNSAGIFFAVLFMATVVCGVTRYVDAGNLTPAAPYTDWNTAAAVIQDAVDAAVGGDVVLVTNGMYDTGGGARH